MIHTNRPNDRHGENTRFLEKKNIWNRDNLHTSPCFGHDLTRSFGNGIHPSGKEFRDDNRGKWRALVFVKSLRGNGESAPVQSPHECESTTPVRYG